MHRRTWPRRIWASFQIQGFIKENIALIFLTDFNGKENKKNARFIVDILLTSMRQNPLISKKIIAHCASVNANGVVSKTVIELSQMCLQTRFYFNWVQFWSTINRLGLWVALLDKSSSGTPASATRVSVYMYVYTVTWFCKEDNICGFLFCFLGEEVS